MADDIVKRLRVIYCAADDLTPCGTCLPCQAADEVERLRVAGDALAEALHGWATVIGPIHPDDAERLRAWKEARRG